MKSYRSENPDISHGAQAVTEVIDRASSRSNAGLAARGPSVLDSTRWRMQLDASAAPVASTPGPIGVFVHLFYPDLTEEIAEYLSNIPYDFELYVSTDSEDKKADIAARLSRLDLMQRTVVKVTPNRGWDLAPFLLSFASEIRQHEIGLKLHGKRSTHQPSKFGRRWRQHLLSELVGDRERVQLIVGNFLRHSELGVVMARHWTGIAKGVNIVGQNQPALQKLLQRIGLSIGSDQLIEYPSGSMFWFRGSALVPLLDVGLTWGDFGDSEQDARDATLAHGVERSFVIFAAVAGFKWAFVPRFRSGLVAKWLSWMRR
jgi:lipopolysaccharide biosynthesis protein